MKLFGHKIRLARNEKKEVPKSAGKSSGRHHFSVSGSVESKQIGEALRIERNERGFSQADIAKRLGVSQSLINYWERGVGSIPAVILLRLAMIYEINVADFFLYTKWGGDYSK